MDYAAIANRLLEVTDLDFEPVAVYLVPPGAPHQAFEGWKHLEHHRYCQALMRARKGDRVLLTPEQTACPAAASAFGFRALPDNLASGKGLVGFGIVRAPSTGKAMFDGMARLPAGSVDFIAACPLSAAPSVPDVVVVEGATESLMWLLLAEVNRTGGKRQVGSTAVLQATCVDATVIPRLEQRMNFSLGCYGCREATDLDTGEAVLGFPGVLLPELAAALEQLAEKAVPRSRAKAAYEQMNKTKET
jgi:uncharacterized protein (DUF169 family)